MSRRRVVVTGLGCVTSLGFDVEEFWSKLLDGQSAIKTIDKFDTQSFPVRIGGVVDCSQDSGFNAKHIIDPRNIKKMDLFIQYGLVAADCAIKDSGFTPRDEDEAFRTAVVIGSGIGGLKIIESTSISLSNSTNSKVTPYFIPAALINLLPGHIGIKYGFKGPNQSVVTACASATNAIGDAMNMIRYGHVDVAITGGTEAPITPVGLAGFSALKALSTRNENPSQASRPWDLDRDGFVMSEGAGILVLEELEHAKKRSAKIYGELIGYGSTSDAYHITAPAPDGSSAIRSMQAAIRDANIDITDINYINAHATSTPIGDKVELQAVEKLFVEQQNHSKVLMSSTKGATGHLLGAAGAIEAIISILAIRDNVVPGTLNLDNPEPSKIDLVPYHSRQCNVKAALSNSFGFGGTNASLIFSRI